MSPWNLAIKNKVAVYILIAIIIVVGWTSYSSLPREASPDITIPLIIVSVPYIGVSPIDIEGLVTQPLERNLKGLKDLKQIASVSKEGLSTIRVEFNTGVDIDEALRRVRDKVNSTRSQLPTDILEPVVTEINLSEFPIMYVNVGGDVGLARLKRIVEDLQDRVEGIPGVLRADISGGLEPEVQVNCDVYRLAAYQIGFDDVVNGIKNENLSIPGGTIDDGRRAFVVRVPGEFKTVKPLEDLVIKIQNGKPIYVRDVAEVDYSFEDKKSYARLGGDEVVSLGVRKRAGENLLRIADEVKKIVNEKEKTLPAGIGLTVSNDQSVHIKRQVRELENSIMTGMVLVVLSLFMFFGFKNSMLISTAIPLSMFIGFIVLSLSGITLNFVVLFSLVLVLGILVDDAIVVIENIYRHQHEYGLSPADAASRGTSEVAVPVATATITTVAAFVPLLFWPGIVGDFMWFLPMTLIITLGASLFVAYVISPVQGAQWINYKKEIRKVKQNLEHPRWWKKYNPVTYLYHKVDEKVFPYLQNQYVAVLSWTLRRKGMTISLAVSFLVLIIVLFGLFNTGVEFFVNVEPSQLSVKVDAPTGTSLDVTNGIVKTLEERFAHVSGRKDIEFLAASAGSSSDIFDFGGQGTSNKGSIALNFYDKKRRVQSTFITLDEIRKSTGGVTGADIRVAKQEMGPPVGPPVSIEISGDDYGQLAALSAEIRSRIKSIPNLFDIKDDYDVGKPEIEVIVDREKAGLLWTNTGQIAGTIRSAISGAEASKYRVGEDEYKIRVRLREDQRTSLEDIEKVHVTFMNRRGLLISIPISAVADVRKTSGVSDIRRKDQKRVITVTGEVEGRVASEVLEDVKAGLGDLKLPTGYTLKFTGKDEEQKKAEQFLTTAFLVTILLVFLILVTEFNSIKVPFVIMLSVILSLIGVFIGLLVTRMPFSVVMTGVGVVSLAGIVVKNAIVLLDFVKKKREEGLPLEEALIQAGRVRLRPVMLTAVTTVLGILPLATGFDFDWRELHFIVGAESAAFWGPLGVAIIFGLTVSTFLTLVIVPTFYALLEEWMEKLKAWSGKFATVKSEPALLKDDAR